MAGAEQRKRRGRPTLSLRFRQADQTIARTVFVLLSWGFTLRSRGLEAGAAEVVGRVAAAVLGRTDSAGSALGPDRIEQIFKEWFGDPAGLSAEPGGWRRDGARIPIRPWAGVTVDYLRSMRPSHIPGETAAPTLAQLSAVLLRSGGRWPFEGKRYLGDPTPTAKAWEGIQTMPRMDYVDPDEPDEVG